MTDEATIRVPMWPYTHQPSGPIPSPPGLPNYGGLNSAIDRSGQPTRGGFEWLVKRGIRTVVSLRAEGPGDRVSVPGSIPLDFHRFAWEDEESPPVSRSDPSGFGFVNDILHLVLDSANWPVLVHCLAGAGRTGVLCAVIRYSVDGWGMEEARREALLYRPGFGRVRWPMRARQKRWLGHYAEAYPAGWAKGLVK